MSVRTVYRDLKAIDEEIVAGLGGRRAWGIDRRRRFLPPLKLTQPEAMAVVLSARLMVRYADKYDPDLAAAFEKLEVGSAAAARGARRADPRRHVDGAARRRLRRARPAPDQGLGRAPGRDHRLRTGRLRGRRPARVGHRPAVPDRAVAPDARPLPDRLRRGPRGRPDVQDRADRDGGADARGRSSAPDRRRPPRQLRRAWDIIADQDPTEVVLRFTPTVATRVSETTWHPTPGRIDRAGRFAHAGGRPSPGPSRSASGSCPGATTWRSSNPADSASGRGRDTPKGRGRYHP